MNGIVTARVLRRGVWVTRWIVFDGTDTGAMFSTEAEAFAYYAEVKG